MENIKLIRLLKTFNKKEFRNFGELISSPFFNKNKNVVSLYKAISEYYPDFRNNEFSKVKLYRKVFIKEKFNEKKFNNYISDIFVLAEKFLSYKVFEKRPYSRNEFTAEFSVLYELRERGLNSLYESKYKKTLEKIDNLQFKNENYYHAMHDMYEDYMWYRPFAKPQSGYNILQEYHDNFIYYAIIKLLKFYSLMLHEKNTANINYNYSFIDEITAYVERNNLPENPAIHIFTKALLLLKSYNAESYRELRKAKDKYFDGLNEWDQRRVLIHMYDYCAYMVNSKGDDSYNRDMFDIYAENLKRNFMTHENFLYPDFINIVKISCRISEFHFAENFIEEYKSSLNDENRSNVLDFCHGIIAFSQKDYKKAMHFLSRTNFRIFIFKVQVKILQLQIYYKLSMYEEAIGVIDNFRHFAARENNLLSEHKESLFQFLRIITELIKVCGLAGNERLFHLSKIKKEAGIIPANPFRIKSWLIEELNRIH